MIRKCACGCGKTFEGNPKKLYYSPKCRKKVEVMRRKAPKTAKKRTVRLSSAPKSKVLTLPSSVDIRKPSDLNPIASAYWDKVAPILVKRGHLNVLSEDAFAELCDLHSRVIDIRKMIDQGTEQQCQECGAEIVIPGNRSLLQIDDKWSIKDGVETACFKESALSDLKRKYSARFLDYCKAFYLTPLSNRGNFGLDDEKETDGEEKDSILD